MASLYLAGSGGGLVGTSLGPGTCGPVGWWIIGGLLGLVGLGRVIGSQKTARRPLSFGGLKGSDSFSLPDSIED